MDDWLTNNLDLIKNAKSVFVMQDGKMQKLVNVIAVNESKIELDNFFEDNICIYFILDKTKHMIDLQILNLSDHGTTYFEMLQHRQEEVKRAQVRVNLVKAQKKVFIVNYISDLEIAAAVEYNNTKIERASYVFSEALRRYFDYVEIYFFHEIMSSVRGKVIQEFKRPIFIYDVNEQHLPENDLEGTIPSEVFFKRIKPYSRRIEAGTQCDITVPILYAGQIPYGYIHVNSKKKYPPAMLAQITRVADKLNMQLLISKIIQPQSEKVALIDISYNGGAVLFGNRRLVTIFKSNALLSFDLVLPGGKTLRMTAYVRNVGSMGKGYVRAGLEFVSISEENQNYLDGFVSGLL